MSENLNLIADPESLFEHAGRSGRLYTFKKADVKPGDKKYQEVHAFQITEEFLSAHPGYLVKTKEIPEGVEVRPGQWVITRNEIVAGNVVPQQYTNDDDKFRARWKPVAGKEHVFSPRSVPTLMVELEAGGQVMTLYSKVPASGAAGAFLAWYGPHDFNIVARKDVHDTYPIGCDDLSVSKLAAIALEYADNG